MKTDMKRHDQKYWLVDGHFVTASFAQNRNSEMFALIQGILLGEAAPHICKNLNESISMGDDAP